jgi:hypothetical protein
MDLMAKPRPGKILGDEGALSDMFGSVSSSRIYLAVVLFFALGWYTAALFGPVWFVPRPVMPREIDLTFLAGCILAFALGAYGKDALMAGVPHISAILQKLGTPTRQAAELSQQKRPSVDVDRSGREQTP